MNKIIPVLMCAVMMTAGIVVLADSVTESGGGNVTLTTKAPVVDSYSWFVPGKGWNATIDPNTEFHVYVNVSDQDTLNDIAEVSMEFFRNTAGTDNKYYGYKIVYTETATFDGDIDGTFAQVLPSSGTFIVNNVTLNQLPVGNHFSQGVHSYIFALSSDNLAQKGTWKIQAKATDSEGKSHTLTSGAIATMNTYLVLNDNSLGAGLNWPLGSATDSFYTNVTSNGGYTLAVNVTGAFVWSVDPTYQFTPTFTIKELMSNPPAYTLTDTLQIWYTSPNTVLVDNNRTHDVVISGLPTNMPGGEYSGITFNMVVTNP